MKGSRNANRRFVLKTIGAGVVGSLAFAGSASGRGDYGNSNGIGAFLNEEAEFKDRPLWSSGIADKTGQSQVSVTVGALTSVDIPEDLVPPGEEVPEAGPFAFEPKAVKVSPGTVVKWIWTGHHSVTSLDGTGVSFDVHRKKGEFTYTFDEVGNYLYYCYPHGTPYSIDLGEPVGSVENLFGMRGAVKVSDD